MTRKALIGCIGDLKIFSQRTDHEEKKYFRDYKQKIHLLLLQRKLLMQTKMTGLIARKMAKENKSK